MKKVSMVAQQNIYREVFSKTIQALEIEGFEFVGRYEKGFLFNNASDHFVTISVTSHKWETETAEGFDGYGALEQYAEKQSAKAEKEAERLALKAKKIAEKEKAKALKEAEKASKTE